MAHDPGVGSLIRVQVYQYLKSGKLSFTPNYFLAFRFFCSFGASPNQLGYGKHLATFSCRVHFV